MGRGHRTVGACRCGPWLVVAISLRIDRPAGGRTQEWCAPTSFDGRALVAARPTDGQGKAVELVGAGLSCARPSCHGYPLTIRATKPLHDERRGRR